MKPAVRVMGIITTVWTVIIFVLIALMMIPVVPGVVAINLPASEGWATTVTNETVSMTSNISVRNGGLFPFNDFFFVIELYGDNDTPLVDFTSDRTNLPTNTWVKIPVSFEINKSAIGEIKLRTMVFDKLDFGGLVYFNVRYLFDFRAQLGLNSTISLGPLIDGDFDLNRTNASLIGDSATLNVPFTLNSSIQGNRNVSLSGTIHNTTQELGSFNYTHVLGQQGQSNLTVNLTREAYDHLVASADHLLLNVTVTFDNFVWNYQTERDWQPPLRG